MWPPRHAGRATTEGAGKGWSCTAKAGGERGLAEARRGKEGSSTRDFREGMASQHLGFRLLALRTETAISVVFRRQVPALWDSARQPQEANTCDVVQPTVLRQQGPRERPHTEARALILFSSTDLVSEK